MVVFRVILSVIEMKGGIIMTVVDIRNIFSGRNIEIFHTDEAYIYYSEEKNDSGKNELFILEYDRRKKHERLITNYTLDDPTFVEHIFAFEETIILILENGKNVAPEFLESKINSIPYVKESIVVPRTAGGRSNILYAIIVLHDDEKKEFLKDDIAAINRNLPSYMQITDFEVSSEELKKNSSRKILRSEYQNE